MLGKTIKDLRKEKGLSQAELAKKIGVSQGAIFFWENEINEPTASNVLSLANFFNVSLDELFSNSVVQSGTPTKTKQLNSLFEKLTLTQQDMVLDLVKELLKP